jgi:hypothetical protein
MSESPGDLAVAFRSFGRRLNEAMAATKDDAALADAGSPSANELSRELVAVMAEAARAMGGVSPDGDVQSTGAAVADAITATPADAWDDARLERLRALALEAGRLLRGIDAAVRAAKD